MDGLAQETFNQTLKRAQDAEFDLNTLREDNRQLDEPLSAAHRLASELVSELERVALIHHFDITHRGGTIVHYPEASLR